MNIDGRRWALKALGIYAGAIVKGVAHRGAAKAWLRFIVSSTATAIFEGYGFEAYRDPCTGSTEE